MSSPQYAVRSGPSRRSPLVEPSTPVILAELNERIVELENERNTLRRQVTDMGAQYTLAWSNLDRVAELDQGALVARNHHLEEQAEKLKASLGGKMFPVAPYTLY